MALVIQTVHDVLEACGCTQYEDNFAGISLEKLRQYSLQDLWEILPGDDGQIAASYIMRVLEQLKNSDSSDEFFENDQEPIFNTVPNNTIPGPSASQQQQQSELDDSSSNDSSIGTSSESAKSINENSDISESDQEEEEEVALPSTSRSVPCTKKPVIEISLSDSEDEEEENPNSPDGINEASQHEQEEVQPSNSRYSFRQRVSKQQSDAYEGESDSGLENDDAGPSAKRSKFSPKSESKKIVTFTPQKFHALLKRVQRDPDFVDSFTNVQLLGNRSTNGNGDHLCSVDDFEDSEWKQWQELFTISGPHITSLELLTWTWKPVKSKCPYNLFKILHQYCPNLSELSLQNDSAYTIGGVKFSDSLNLLNLKTLKITHEQELNYREQLECILKAAVNLNEFKYTFVSFDDLNFVLDIFKKLEKSQIKNLKILSIRSFTKNGYLKLEQINVLSQLEAEELEELELGNGLWEDIDGSALEQLFSRFPKLKKIIIYGSFQGNSVKKPNILIKLPPLTNLEYLDIGGNYEFASIFEDESQDNRTTSLERVITVDDEVTTDLYSVSLALPLLPNLKTIILGNLFKIDNLHFASLPKLSAFRVGSPWHLSVHFPSQESRRNCYPLIKELQIPDCLKDPSFVRQIPHRFPNLEKCWIFLATVEVLRSFFKSMENANLQELYLKTQFDFECLMELCLLGHPTQAIRSYTDYMKLEDLENYEKFNDFVKFHNIELPPKKRDDLESEEYAGLQALKNLKLLRMEHVPRILRIPKGQYHHTHYKCEFTNEYIGFRSYPLSRACLAQLPIKNLISCTWPNFQVNLRDVKNFADNGFAYCDSGDSDNDAWGTETSSSTSRQNKKGTKLKVQIQPSMLQADLKFHQKQEKTE